MKKIHFFKGIIFLGSLFSMLLSGELNAATSSCSISYEDMGSGKPLVLIHAFPTDQRLFKPQQEKLKKHFRVITLDLWGFGQSAKTDGQAIAMTNYADEVKQLLDKLRIKKAIIGGESMGGYIALAFLQKYPNNINRLILSNTQSIADSPEAKIKREKTALDVLQRGTKSLIDGFTPKAISPNASKETKQLLKNILTAQKPEGVASALRGMSLREDTSDTLANTSLPVLIITSDHDELVPAIQSEHMHTLAKNSKLVVIKGAEHLSNLDKPAEWNQAVIEMFH